MANTDDLALLEELLLARGPGGQEDAVRAICWRELKRHCDEVWIDAADNVIGIVRAGDASREEAIARSVLIMAHQDEIAMVVKRINPDGTLNVVALGGAFPINFGVCPVDIMGDEGIFPGVLSFGTMHATSESPQGADVLSGNVQWTDVHILTRRSKEELGTLGIRAGTRVILSQHWRKPFLVNDCVAAHFLDDRAPVVATLKAAALAAERKAMLKRDALFVFTTKEEETNAGAQYAARTLPGEICIAVEVGPIANEYDTHLSADPIILTGDEKGYYSKTVADDLLHAAQRCGYNPQPALMPDFASDASAVLSSGASAKAGCIAIPTENTHGYEVILQDGMEACAQTLLEYLLNSPLR
ncbi:putative aminopeptidase FrvX [Pseudomonas duriflava]|uniref:Putative aminopeptidase FrvX n=1 Tax=Pseudomonas duriflava TaxID=459528 RepID=A0A562QE37_9PSED|nr:M42 family metallopeptidase [Pseudomonas duriflava]TWI55001.1 putative aminopeptidase FrvX [Pseudomonas duriflava]